MDPHLIELPKKILVGRDVVFKIPSLCKGSGIRGPGLVLTGSNTLKVGGERVFEDLKSISNVNEYPKLEIVEEGSLKEAKRLKKKSGDLGFVVSVGGGKVIDVGKLLAFDLNIPFISVPTAPSHDGIASERVSLKNGNSKHSFRAKPPFAIVADIRILSRAPYRLIASGCADVISNYTAVYDWKLGREQGEYYSEYAATLSMLSAEIVLRSAKLIKDRKERGIRNLVEALITSGISISLAGTSRPASGSEHMFSHALDLLGSEGLHGEQCGLGSVLMAYLHDGSQELWEKIRDVLKDVGAPTTAREIGINEDMIIGALLKARDIRKRYTILDKAGLDREKALEACRATGVF